MGNRKARIGEFLAHDERIPQSADLAEERSDPFGVRRTGHQPTKALCSQSEPMFDDFCTRAGPTFAYLLRPAGILGLTQGEYAASASDPMAEAVCAQLGLKPGTLQA